MRAACELLRRHFLAVQALAFRRTRRCGDLCTLVYRGGNPGAASSVCSISRQEAGEGGVSA